MSEATPRPWVKEEKYIAVDLGNNKIRPLGCLFDDANIEFVINAVNTYDEREALIRELVAALNSLRDEVSGGISSESGVEELKPMIHHEAVVKADAALAKAREVMGGGE